ncbi:putative DNA primase large subunit [Leishmania infantum JPCM5]|uniref:DNA primase large subunit n=2 Tax=Leishmania infantum TaxID=5671 RepID=A0A6L0WGZ0_LEIIN|nr:putative DNA primase large subunit [Leishmania infantum JPCM5]CAC9438656.1 DNA_primase_large_subunit_-_putative [Leishmania infantum]CBZ08312.1 putative DNA primase large subunit [Leishmania infantum JPCM5]SUZ38704.1 DNA_primase_large_subunit_-_putative [Leishmania infantum]|eukprot:XP_003392180.1 putative DNA primase large subunit [Leishmania infantum JPCM5]
MQAITASTPSQQYSAGAGIEKPLGATTSADWMTMYEQRPHGNSTLFELEAMVAKRMEFLAWVDQQINSPQAKSFDSVLDAIIARLPEERRSSVATDASRGKMVLLGYDETAAGGCSDRRSSSRGSTGSAAGSSQAAGIVFAPEEDVTSHLLCRFAFCMSERWRDWLVRTERVLLTARIKMEMAKRPVTFLVDLMKRNGLPCAPLTDKQLADPMLQEYLEYRRVKAESARESEGRAENYYAVPLSLATRLIKKRYVLCRAGQTILFRDQVQEVFLTVFCARLNRGLHNAYLARVKQQALEEETTKSTVMAMLDAFLQQFISDPVDTLQEGVAGSVKAGDVQRLAQAHFPPCMRAIDWHLRREGHLKHHGRFMYGLFLKSIGLSLEDSLELFATLMKVKGGGSVEAFAKTAYGYNVRHNYGMEGKKMSYSSASCATILGLPPVVDQHDCHGCPFRFRDEGALRTMLGKETQNPKGCNYPSVRPTPGDIEDIVSDSKAQHYTRACYKYFMATHPGARRDTLFRSPYEYYSVSLEFETPSDSTESARPSAVPGKRTSVVLNEDVLRLRTSP